MNTKNEMIEAVAEESGLTKAAVARLYASFFNYIGESLIQGNEVRISGFGTFVTKERPARTARNPKTGGTIDLPATTVAKFRPAKSLKEAVAQ